MTATGPHDTLPAGLPSRTAYLLAFGAVVLAGLFGGTIGYGLVDVTCDGRCAIPDALGALVGAAGAAIGVGIVAVLVLRAMSEWRRDAARARRPERPQGAIERGRPTR